MQRFKETQPLAEIQTRARSSRLQGLVSHAERIAEWDQAMQPRLPERLRHQVRLLNLRQGLAVFGCRDGLGHHLVRWHERALTALLKSVTGQPVKRVQAQVWRDPIGDQPAPAQHARRISQKAARHLAVMAENEPDPAWRELLSRLAKRT